MCFIVPVFRLRSLHAHRLTTASGASIDVVEVAGNVPMP